MTTLAEQLVGNVEYESGYFRLLQKCYELPLKCVRERCYCNPSTQQVIEVAVLLHKVSVKISPKICCNILEMFSQKLKLEKM